MLELELELGEEELDELLGELVEPELEPLLEPMPDDVPPEEVDPDLLKYASHSEREIWPSLFLSTDEKLGVVVELDEPLAADGDEVDDEDDGLEDDESVVADGLDVDGLDEDGLDDDEDCATASVDSANITAAAVMVRPLGMDSSSGGWESYERLRASFVPAALAACFETRVVPARRRA